MGRVLSMLNAGGNWNNSSNCRSRCRNCNNSRSNVNSNNGSRSLIRKKVWLNSQLKLIRDELELTFSKADVFDTKQGVDFCGYRHFGKYVLLRKKTSKRIKKRFKDINKELGKENYDNEKIRSQIASTLGWLKHACCYNFRNKLIRKGGKIWIFSQKSMNVKLI